MTSNQLSYGRLLEEQRHNREQEKIGKIGAAGSILGGAGRVLSAGLKMR